LTATNKEGSVRENKLGFPILSDPRNDVAAAFGLRFALPVLNKVNKKLAIAPVYSGGAPSPGFPAVRRAG
jgi:hypothetical protein